MTALNKPKTLGSRDDPRVLALWEKMDELDKPQLARFAMAYARETFLPMYLSCYPQDTRLQSTLDAAEGWLAGTIPFRVVKDLILNSAHAAAREAHEHPGAQAAARAIAQAASAIHVKQHALGLVFYGAMANYRRLNGKHSPEDCLTATCTDITNSLIKFRRKQEKP